MCGIFGFVQNPVQPVSYGKTILEKLFLLSEKRGKEAAGLAFSNNGNIFYYKSPLSASELLRTPSYKEITDKYLNQSGSTFIGHSRLVTNGLQTNNLNNQPAVFHDIAAVHNGIITNEPTLWKKCEGFSKASHLDTEVFLLLIRKFLTENAGNLKTALTKTYELIEGVASTALLLKESNSLILSTNNGSLYFSHLGETFAFASEQYILQQVLAKINECKDSTISRLEAGQALCLNADTLDLVVFDYMSSDGKSIEFQDVLSKEFVDLSPTNSDIIAPLASTNSCKFFNIGSDFSDEYPQNSEAISNLKRCTKCVMPETMPFIEFDDNGVCNYCHSYSPMKFLGVDELREILLPLKNQVQNHNCLVTLSGGRDSCFGLHFMKEEMGMKPVTYTYDWGMVTDLARRNQMRMCGKLGVEHILVSANIEQKRKNIQRNVNAWLKKPNLGTVPLFMAGDKLYFYYANLIAKQTKSELVVLCENMLETTRFKSGFCGIPPLFDQDAHTYSLSIKDKIKMIHFYCKEYLTNPSYINASLLDTFKAFCSYYIIQHNYLNLFDYLRWDENYINSLLINEYNWEIADDTDSTWRIGDGTAPFYNYIYYTIAGFTENDTFRSNQVREGMITRDQALTYIENENVPRYQSMEWYFETIGIDFKETISTINNVPKLYQDKL